MAPIFHQQQMDHHAHHAAWEDGRQARPGAHYPLQQHQHQHQHQQWPAQGRLHINPAMVRDDGFAAAPPMQQHHGSMSASRHHQPQQHPLGSSSAGREVLGEGSFMGRGYSIKRCQGFVRCDMDIDAEVVGWVIGKNGSTIKDMKHKTGCNMWVDQRALKLTITGPDLPSVEHAAKSVDAYVAAAPIKAGAVEAAVTKTIECPPQLLDDLGDRTTIARIVKETHAQVVVNKKIGRIIVRGDHRSVDLAYESVQAMIHNAVHGSYGLGLRVSTPDSHGSFGVAGGGGRAGYFPDGAMSSSGRGGGGGGGGGDMRSPLVSGAVAAAAAGMHHLMLPSTAGGAGGSSHGDPNFHHLAGPDYHHTRDTAEFHHLATWQQEQQQLELKPEHSHQPLQRHHHHNHGRGVGSDTDDSEIETVSLGSIGARTPVSSTAGSPRVVGSYNTSPALSGTASTPVGDWSLFSGGFGIGMAALQEGESSTSRSSTPTTARTTPRVHFPEGLRALVGGAAGASAASAGDLAVLKGSGLLSPASAADGNSGGGSNGGGGKPAGSLAPPPSPSSTADGEASRRMAGLPVPEAQVLSALEGQGSDGEEEQEGSAAAAAGGGGEDISDKVARLGKVLQTMGLGKYCPKFAENEVDLEALGLMSESDLADIGIPKGPRLKILNAVGARAAAGANHAPAV